MSEFTRLAVAYTAVRLAVFTICLILLGFSGLQGIVQVAVALVASGLLSYRVGRRQRDRLVAAYEARRDARRR